MRHPLLLQRGFHRLHGRHQFIGAGHDLRFQFMLSAPGQGQRLILRHFLGGAHGVITTADGVIDDQEQQHRTGVRDVFQIRAAFHITQRNREAHQDRQQQQHAAGDEGIAHFSGAAQCRLEQHDGANRCDDKSGSEHLKFLHQAIIQEHQNDDQYRPQPYAAQTDARQTRMPLRHADKAEKEFSATGNAQCNRHAAGTQCPLRMI